MFGSSNLTCPLFFYIHLTYRVPCSAAAILQAAKARRGVYSLSLAFSAFTGYAPLDYCINACVMVVIDSLKLLSKNLKCTLCQGHISIFTNRFLVVLPSVRSLWFRDLQRIFTSSDVCVVFCQGQFGQIPLVSFIVAVIRPVHDFLQDILHCFAIRDIHLVFHVTEKGFLRRIIPTVCSSGHRLS